jgi:hypothetical protein
VLSEILWFQQLQEQHPDRFFHFFQYEVSRQMLTNLAAFLRVNATDVWLDSAMTALEINEGYRHSRELVNFYQRRVAERFAQFPGMKDRLMQFCT